MSSMDPVLALLPGDDFVVVQDPQHGWCVRLDNHQRGLAPRFIVPAGQGYGGARKLEGLREALGVLEGLLDQLR